MRLKFKILFIIFVCLFTAMVSLYTFINIHGKSILTAKLQRALGREVKIRTVRATPLFNIRIKDIEIPGLLKIDRIIAKGGAIDIFRKNFILSELHLNGAVVNIERPKEKPKPQETALQGQENVPVMPSYPKTTPKATERKIFLSGLTVDYVRIKDSTINFTDRSIEEEGIKIIVKDLFVRIENLALPVATSNITYFEIKGTIPWQTEGSAKEGEIYASGWINLYKKDMQAKLVIKDIDAISLYPYYAKWVDLEKSRIKKATLRFNSDIVGHSGEVTAECHLELADLVFRPKEENEPEDKAHKIAMTVLDLFQSFGGKVAVDFTIKTRMDKPNFDFDSIRTAVEDKINRAAAAQKGEESDLETVLAFPVKLLEGGVRSATDISRALIDGAFAVGKEVKEGVEDIMQDRKKKEEERKREGEEGNQGQETPQSTETK